jgi:hypothetical protein
MNNIGQSPQLLSKLDAELRAQGKTIDGALQQIFTSAQAETVQQKTRRIMGNELVQTADEDLEAYIVEFQYLIDSWLNQYERQAFDGQTLKQLLGRG